MKLYKQLISICIIALCLSITECMASTNSNSIQSTGKIGFSRSNPAPVGTPVEFTGIGSTNQGGVDCTLKVTLLDIKRGDTAAEIIHENYNQEWSSLTVDDIKTKGMAANEEYMLARFKVELLDAPTIGTFLPVDHGSFGLDVDNHLYYSEGNYEPKDELFDTIYENGVAEGWITFVVDKTKMPLVCFTNSKNGPIWFKIT